MISEFAYLHSNVYIDIPLPTGEKVDQEAQKSEGPISPQWLCVWSYDQERPAPSASPAGQLTTASWTDCELEPAPVRALALDTSWSKSDIRLPGEL